jgi:hypothetical protein
MKELLPVERDIRQRLLVSRLVRGFRLGLMGAAPLGRKEQVKGIRRIKSL